MARFLFFVGISAGSRAPRVLSLCPRTGNSTAGPGRSLRSAVPTGRNTVSEASEEKNAVPHILGENIGLIAHSARVSDECGQGRPPSAAPPLPRRGTRRKRPPAPRDPNRRRPDRATLERVLYALHCLGRE